MERDDGGVHRGRPVELDSRVPTVVVMHALTSDALVLGAPVAGGKPW